MTNEPNAKRPESRQVMEALEADNMEALAAAMTFRQKAFCSEFIKDFVGSHAAIRAGYSVKAADKQAYILLRHRGISRYIEHLLQERKGEIKSISPEYVIQEVTSIISKEGAKDTDRLRGLELLARHLGMFIDRTEITGKDGEAIQVENRRIEQEADNFTNTLNSLRKKAQEDKKKDVHLEP